jgi:hypothetical protein
VARRDVDGHPVRDLEAGDLALELVLEALEVELAVALVDLAVPVLRVRRRGRQALLLLLRAVHRVQLGRVRRRQFEVAVDAEDLQALHRRRPHHDPMGDPLGVPQVRRVVVDDQVLGVDGQADRPVAQRAEVDLLERRAAEALHQQHAVGVRVVLRGHRRQVVVGVLLERLGQRVL